MSQNVNLYPQEIREGQEVMPARIMLLAVGGVSFILGIAFAWGLYGMFAVEHELSTLEAERAELQLQRDDLQRIADRLKEDPALDVQIQKQRKALREKTRVLSALAHQDTHNAKGFSPYLTSLATRRVEGVWLEQIEFGDGGKRIRLVGKALNPASVPVLINRLSSEEPFRGKEFKKLVMKRPEGKDRASFVEFELATSERKPAP